jgi:hypothetical protein
LGGCSAGTTVTVLVPHVWPPRMLRTQHAGLVFDGVLEISRIQNLLTLKAGMTSFQLNRIASLFQVLDARQCGEVSMRDIAVWIGDRNPSIGSSVFFRTLTLLVDTKRPGTMKWVCCRNAWPGCTVARMLAGQRVCWCG